MVFAAGFERLDARSARRDAQGARLDGRTVDRLAALGTPAGEAAARFIGRRIDAYSSGDRVARADAAPVHDALCTAFLVDPRRDHDRALPRARGDATATLTVGRTVIDTRTHAPEPPNCPRRVRRGRAPVRRTARRDARTRVKRRRQQLSPAIVAAGFALFALAGCGGSADPLQAVRNAATNTLALTAQSTLTLTGAQLFGESPTIVGRGEFSFPKGLGYEGLQLPPHGRRAAGTAYLVFLPGRVWIRPVSSAALPDGDLWISTRLNDPQSGGAPTQALALVLEGTNPQLLLEEIATGAIVSIAFRPPRRRSRALRRVRRVGRPGKGARRDEHDRTAPGRDAATAGRTPCRRARARVSGSWRASTVRNAWLSCSSHSRARSSARFRSVCGSSAARSH